MPSTAIVDVAIGIAFVYLFLSLVCSVVNEGIAAILSLRAKNLVAGINSLFSESKTADGKKFVQAIYEHGLVRGLFKDPPAAAGTLANVPAVLAMAEQKFKVNLPSYIPSGTFATALIDAVAPPNAMAPRSLDDVRKGIAALPDSPTKQALLSLVAATKSELPEFEQKVEAWFNASMDRAAGWYKRQAQNILLVIGLVVTLALNVDTIKLTQSLWSDPVARQGMVDLAQTYVTEHPNPPQRKQGVQEGTSVPAADAETKAPSQTPAQQPTSPSLEDQIKQLTALGQKLPFPLGWQKPPEWSASYWITSIVGWLITALALSLGAPFWFDTLSKFMVVRSTIKPQGKSKKS